MRTAIIDSDIYLNYEKEPTNIFLAFSRLQVVCAFKHLSYKKNTSYNLKYPINGACIVTRNKRFKHAI